MPRALPKKRAVTAAAIVACPGVIIGREIAAGKFGDEKAHLCVQFDKKESNGVQRKAVTVMQGIRGTLNGSGLVTDEAVTFDDVGKGIAVFLSFSILFDGC